MGLLRKRVNLIEGLNNYEISKLRNYAEKNGLSLEEALKEAVEKGVRYIDLEDAYGKEGISDRELWDKRYHFLRVESAYLHYRLLLKDTLDEFRKLLLTFSSVVSSLELCYRSLPSNKAKELRKDEIRKLKTLVNIYVNGFLKPSEEDLKNTDINDEEVIKEIKDMVRKYEEVFKNAAKKGEKD